MPNNNSSKFQEFVEEEETLINYLERLELFFAVNETEEAKKALLLLNNIGKKPYAILKNLLVPDLPRTKTYQEIVAALKAYYSPKTSIIAERCKLNKRFQKENESISLYAMEIKKMAAVCEYGAFLQDAIRDRLVSGLRNEDIQRKLMAEKNLTFQKALDMAVSLELATQNVKSLHEPALETVSQVNNRMKNKKEDTKTNKLKPCYC